MSRLLALLLLLLPAMPAAADSIHSAQWQLVQRGPALWESRLRLPEDFDGRLLSLQPQGPAGCTRLGEPRLQPAQAGTLFVWALRCPQGPGALSLQGFSLQVPDAVFTLQPLDGEPRHAVLSTRRPDWSPDAAASSSGLHYLRSGIAHLLAGADHVLFVIGLWALWRRSGRSATLLVGTLTAFTAAHSLTLGGAALAGWRLPAAAVEACIAASILLLAVELATQRGRVAGRGLALRAFAFGLLHGFGFADGLLQGGLPEGARLWALAAFNLGVEFGQLLLVAALLLLARLARPLQRFAPLALCLYGTLAAGWLIERSAAVLGRGTLT